MATSAHGKQNYRIENKEKSVYVHHGRKGRLGYQANMQMFLFMEVDEGVPMTHVDYTKWQCHSVKFKKSSCHLSLSF